MCFPSLSWNKKREVSFPESLCFFALSQEKDRWLGGTLHPLRSNLSRQVVHTVFLLITRTCEGNFFINEDTFLWFTSWVSFCFVKWLFLQSLRYTVVEFKIYLIFILIIIYRFCRHCHHHYHYCHYYYYLQTSLSSMILFSSSMTALCTNACLKEIYLL